MQNQKKKKKQRLKKEEEERAFRQMMKPDVEEHLKRRRAQRATVSKRFQGWMRTLFTLAARLLRFSLCK